MTTLNFQLPWPPSLNHLFPNGKNGKRFLSKQARSFRKSVGDNVLIQRVPRHQISGRLSIEMHLHAPDARVYDIDNRVKATLDALEKNGVIATDSAIDSLHVYRSAPCPPLGHVDIEIQELRP